MTAKVDNDAMTVEYKGCTDGSQPGQYKQTGRLESIQLCSVKKGAIICQMCNKKIPRLRLYYQTGVNNNQKH